VQFTMLLTLGLVVMVISSSCGILCHRDPQSGAAVSPFIALSPSMYLLHYSLDNLSMMA